MLIRADARALPLADASVDLVVTSPPYWALRSYTDGGEHYAGQIGAEPTPAAYIDSLIECTREWMRVLKPSGSIFVNLGDKYAGSDGSPGGPSMLQGGKKQRAVQGNGRRGSSDTGIRAKSLMDLPARYSIRCIDDLGLIKRAEIIWSKPNGLPESVTDRVRRSHEQWFHFTKSPRYYAAVDTIREAPANPSKNYGAGGAGNTALRARNLSLDKGAAPYAGPNPLGKLPGSVWEIATQPLKVPAELDVDHFAAFPMEWPRRIILGWSPSGICTACGEGRRPVTERQPMQWRESPTIAGRSLPNASRKPLSGTMLAAASSVITGEACACPDASAPTRPSVIVDPFGGTGTTALVAEALGRSGVSVDMSADYLRLAAWRTSDPGERARALGVDKPPPVTTGQLDIFGGAA